jgi:SecD/SecF fusion protein
VNHPPSFEQETNFDPQVAGEMQQDAFLALTFSVIAIMIYIWVRFGNLKYGTATVVALLHDTLFTLAALGFAHYITQFWTHNFLQIEPFRINLTVVAGILTIMGYSMIDTIVVFDRIRENRGRYGHLDRRVINDAINQTLSRTVLTCGTTIMTVSFMYFLGGAGIHGFTFVLLVGILVGTYSSVAIAAPMLLWWREKDSGTGAARPPADSGKGIVRPGLAPAVKSGF